MSAVRTLLVFSTAAALVACGDAPDLRDEPSPPFRNVGTATAYVGDEACADCHADAASAYREHAMARSFHRWTPAIRIDTPLEKPIRHGPTGFSYTIVETDGRLYQLEYLTGPDGQRRHELRRSMDYVMGSGEVARTYFTEENGRLFQLPLTWYRDKGWDFSPGYEVNNARFDRLMPDQCIACHSSYPRPVPFLEGKYAELRPGIGCERCHGPGALHVEERLADAPPDSGYDATIVNPRHLPFARRLDVCEQCHVHTPVSVLRDGHTAFDYVPSQPLRDHIAFFRATGSIDIVSHAGRLRQSACFVATRSTDRPLECATCHDPHRPPLQGDAHNRPCRTCHAAPALEQRLAASSSAADHGATADCVTCHMPQVKERTVPHGTFTDHWIRVVRPGSAPVRAARNDDAPIEPYFERDRAGRDGRVYRGMGQVVFATLANRARLLDEAAAALARALGRDSTRSDAHFLLGLAHQQLQRTDDAIAALEQSLRIEPDRPERLHALAQAYRRTGRNRDSIDVLYRRALELQPALAWIRADYADFLHARGRRADAEREYRTALAEQPSLAVAWFNLGTLLAGQGQLQDAEAAFQEVVRLNPSMAEALATLLHVRATDNVVTGVRLVGSPLPSLLVRDRGPDAVRLSVTITAAGPQGLFVNVPPEGSVHILEEGGTVIRTLRAGTSSAVVWDLLDQAGTLIAGGLYRVRVEGGRIPQIFHFGVIRTGSAG